MRKLLLVLLFFILTIHTSNAEKLFINKDNAKTITLQQIKNALNKGANVNDKDKYGLTPLMWTSMNNGNPKVIELLLQYGANIYAKDKDDNTPLMLASAYNGNPKVIELLLQHGANIHARDKDGWTPLIRAGLNINPKVIELALD